MNQRKRKNQDDTSCGVDQHEDDYIHVDDGFPPIGDTSKSERAIVERIKYIIGWQRPLRRCLLLAALACILRPTNILIWICVACFALFSTKTYGQFMEVRWIKPPVWLHIVSLELFPATAEERKALFSEATLCGYQVSPLHSRIAANTSHRSFLLFVSTIIDFLYYGQLTFPPLRFLYFNIAQSLAIFYGRNRWDYYFTEGLPLLLTTFLPFGVLGIYYAIFPPRSESRFLNNSAYTQTIKYQLAVTSIIIPLILSLISHKEVRFIYPLLPLLHLLAAAPFTSFFLPSISPAIPRRSPDNIKRLLLGLVLLTNISIALLATKYHQIAPLSVMAYLRQQHVTHYLSQPPPSTLPPAPSAMTVGFLMPCHSTPWRSHLVFPGIKAWALSCEPPINMNSTARASYVDEADRFYADPKPFLAATLGPAPLARPDSHSWFFFGWFSTSGKAKPGFGREELIEADAWDGRPGKKTWPEYLVFFQEKEPLLAQVLR
ncbi:MAG: hypothetical protein Q9163_006037, partial [Psora crenata]